jgi:hypothetical protein
MTYSKGGAVNQELCIQQSYLSQLQTKKKMFSNIQSLRKFEGRTSQKINIPYEFRYKISQQNISK